jgi:hypothetical protein
MRSWEWIDSAADDRKWLLELRHRRADQYCSITAAMWRIASGDQECRPYSGSLSLCQVLEPPVGLVYARWTRPGAPAEQLWICLASPNAREDGVPPQEYRWAEDRWSEWRGKR